MVYLGNGQMETAESGEEGINSASHAVCCTSTEYFRSVNAGRLGIGPITLNYYSAALLMDPSLLKTRTRGIKSLGGLGSKSRC
jgi:hypothetical protein